jgi:hypothetical protein
MPKQPAPLRPEETPELQASVPDLPPVQEPPPESPDIDPIKPIRDPMRDPVPSPERMLNRCPANLGARHFRRRGAKALRPAGRSAILGSSSTHFSTLLRLGRSNWAARRSVFDVFGFRPAVSLPMFFDSRPAISERSLLTYLCSHLTGMSRRSHRSRPLPTL